LDKQYFFLSGLPRAGNTLFASLMNQNPDVAVTGNSPVAEIIHSISKLYDNEVLSNFPDTNSLDNVMRNIIPNYYEKWNEKYIIDRQAWGHESVLQQLKKHLTNDVKIIVLVRPLEQVLASFIRLSKTTDDNFIANHSNDIEKQCDLLMTDNGMIDLQLKGIKNLMRFENRGLSHFIEYNDLVKNPQEELGKAYEFLGIPKFKHIFTNLKQVNHNGSMYDDGIYGMDLHKIKTDSVQFSRYAIKDYLPEHIIKKCQSINFWQNKY
jgi:sulfotransferase